MSNYSFWRFTADPKFCLKIQTFWIKFHHAKSYFANSNMKNDRRRYFPIHNGSIRWAYLMGDILWSITAKKIIFAAFDFLKLVCLRKIFHFWQNYLTRYFFGILLYLLKIISEFYFCCINLHDIEGSRENKQKSIFRKKSKFIKNEKIWARRIK